MTEHNILSSIEEIIMNETGIIINKDRFIDLEIVLHSRLIFYEMSPDDYVHFLRHNYDELILLASCFTIQETSFYRYKAHFDRVKLEILPELIEKKKHEKKIRIISAGCSTGEEPYTLSMIINDLIPDNHEWDIKILGTDINENALKIATEAIYSKYKLRNIENWYIDRYFDANRTDTNSVQYKLKECIKRLVIFRQYNLIKEPFELAAPDSVDIIFCENVIIYFCDTSIQRLINNFYSSLRQDGYLFLGYAETLNFVTHRFSLTWWHDSFAYKKSQEGEVDVPLAVKSIDYQEEYIDEKLKSNNKQFYDDLVLLIINNYKEGIMDNVAFLIRKIETGSIRLDENFFIIKAEYMFDAKDYINAANECRKAISINPHFIDAHILLSAIYLQFEMLDSAAFEIHTSLYINSASVLANYYFAVYYRRIDDEENYVNYLEKAHRMLMENRGKFDTRHYPINKTTRQEIKNELNSRDGYTDKVK